MRHAAHASSRRRGKGDEGVVLVEFALTLPLLIMFLLGIFTGGMVVNSKLSMAHATREGARYASSVAASQTFSSGTWASNVRDLVVERSGSDLQTSEVCVALVSGSGGTLAVKSPTSSYSTSGSPCISGQTYPVTSGDPGLRVQVSASRPGKIEMGVFGAMTVTLREKATAKSESTA